MPQKGNLSPYFLRGPGKAGIVAGVGQGFKLVIGNDKVQHLLALG